jgi:hypothetical protein
MRIKFTSVAMIKRGAASLYLLPYMELIISVANKQLNMVRGYIIAADLNITFFHKMTNSFVIIPDFDILENSGRSILAVASITMLAKGSSR